MFRTMSVAFTREEDLEATAADLADRPISPHPNLVTPEGLALIETELAAARDRQIVVYCATGGRSVMAAAVLQMMGFKNVLNMEGGYTRWVDDGMPQVHEATY